MSTILQRDETTLGRHPLPQPSLPPPKSIKGQKRRIPKDPRPPTHPSTQANVTSMNTGRPTSRNANPGVPGGTAPRRKVASMAQMDISSMATAFQSPAKPVSYSGGSSTVSSSGRPIVMASNGGGNGSSSYSSNVSNSSGSQGGGAYQNVAYMMSSNAMGHNVTSNNNNSTAPPRLSTANRGRSSNSVATNASFRSTISNSNSTVAGNSGARVSAASAVTAGVGTGGSVTSDDGTISEDSDRAGDEMQLFSGGNSSSGPFGSLGRHPSLGSMYSASSGPGSKHQMRTRTSSSTVGLSNGSSNNNSGTTTPTHAKPMRIAAGASIKVDSAPSTGNGHSSITTNPPASTLLSVRQTGNGGGDDGGSTVSGISAVSGISNQQQTQQPTVRSVKPTGSTLSNASAAAAANKLAEENRRAEEAARTRRKIADLEISNASLLSINSSLEATIRKQTSEMHELKMRMQSSHYGELGVTAADLALAQSVEAIELTEAEKQDELTFKRLCLTIEQMVVDAKQALDQSLKPAGVKVLTLYDMYEKEALEEAAAAAKAEAEAQGEAGTEEGNFGELDESGQGAEKPSISRVHLEEVEFENEQGTPGNLDEEDLDEEDHDRSDSVLSTDKVYSKSSNSSADSLATPPTSTRTIMSTSFSPPPPSTSLTAVAT